MSDYNQIDGAALDRYITGNYGEDQFRGLLPCSDCEESGEVVVDDCLCPVVVRSDCCYRPCSLCNGEGYIEKPEPEDCSCFRYEEDEAELIAESTTLPDVSPEGC